MKALKWFDQHTAYYVGNKIRRTYSHKSLRSKMLGAKRAAATRAKTKGKTV